MEDSQGLDYKKIKIEALLLYGSGFEIEIYINLAKSKFLKISHRDEDATAVLKKYQERGLEDVYLPPDDFGIFTATVRKMLLDRIKTDTAEEAQETAPPTDEKIEKKAKNLNAAHDVVKTIFASGNMTDENKELAKILTDETIKMVKRTNIFEKFSQFKKTCSAEYLHVVLVCYICNNMLDNFTWGNDQIKQKVTLAALVCDVNLTPEEFELLEESKGDKTKLNKKILFHPIETASQLAQESKFFSSETLAIVEQHHEQPNGSGFPKGLDYTRISPLTAVYIVASYFVDRMFDKSYDENDKDWNKEKLQQIIVQIKNKYYSGNFRKAYESINQLFGQ